MQEKSKFTGVWPVMITPFTDRREIDWISLEKLINWYIGKGVHGLFAACKSSEMFELSDKELLQLTNFVLDVTDKRVPVVASGHTGDGPTHQSEQIQAMSETRVDAVILISNRISKSDESAETTLENLKALMELIPQNIDLGVYECPAPYRRLMSLDMVRYMVETERFVFIKDCCCDISMIRDRLDITRGTRLQLANANAQTLLDSYKSGASGYSSVMANFHPEIYVWLYENWKSQPEKAQIVSDFLTVSAATEAFQYPISAKYLQKTLGNFETIASRMTNFTGFMDSFIPAQTEAMMRLGDYVKNHIIM